jgi:hypothetical protein
MTRIALAAGLLATALAPAAAMAQVYYDPPSHHYNEVPSADKYYRDSAALAADKNYDWGREAQRRAIDDQDQFTGRVGSAWRDGQGRRCQWREVTWRDDDGYAAYKWVTICRY